MRAVSGAAGFCYNGFAERPLEITLADVALPEEARRRTFQRPGLNLIPIVFGLHDQLDVRISPVELGERTGERDAVVEIVRGRHVVVSRHGPCSHNKPQNGNSNDMSHRDAPSFKSRYHIVQRPDLIDAGVIRGKNDLRSVRTEIDELR